MVAGSYSIKWATELYTSCIGSERFPSLPTKVGYFEIIRISLLEYDLYTNTPFR
jgi:hypothetical protein